MAILKTAVLISGQLRTFKKCYPTQKWQIFRHYEPDIHFFVSICNDAQAGDVALLQRDYPNVHVETYDDPTDLPVIPPEAGSFAPYANATSHAKLMLQHWGNKKAFSFFNRTTKASRVFDTIIRIRPDQWIHRFAPPRRPDEAECFCPWWGKFGGCNDRIAVMGKLAACNYFNLYAYIEEKLKAGCPFHPETLLAVMLGNMALNTLMVEASTFRMDGSQRWAEIVMSDLAELITSK